MMIKREWRQLLEMIKFSLGKGKAPKSGDRLGEILQNMQIS